MTEASCEMASGAALRARAISASRSIKYCSTGAMVGYGCLASCPGAGLGIPRAAAKTNALSKILRTWFRVITFLRNFLILYPFTLRPSSPGEQHCRRAGEVTELI